VRKGQRHVEQSHAHADHERAQDRAAEQAAFENLPVVLEREFVGEDGGFRFEETRRQQQRVGQREEEDQDAERNGERRPAPEPRLRAHRAVRLRP